MINSLIGLPGGGKSYEAVAYHVLPALQKGRKVITNLPLQLDAFAAVDPAFLDLIELRTETRCTCQDPKHARHAFACVEDYGDPWRHPETGAGPLYVIDECHMALPKIGTPLAIEEWFALHRHETADVLLMTQRPSKVNQEIIQLSQMVYRVKKATALGSQDSYIRKVQDGFRGEVVNTSIRKYQARFFPFYKSHTKGGGAETEASDVVAFWKRWPVIGAGLLLFVALPAMVLSFDLSNPFKPKPPPVQAQKPSMDKLRQQIAAEQGATAPAPSLPPVTSTVGQVETPPEAPDPFSDKVLHLAGTMTGRRPDGSTFQASVFNVSQNGVKVASIRLSELEAIGYSWQSFGECSGVLTLGQKVRTVSCDMPTVTMGASIRKVM